MDVPQIYEFGPALCLALACFASTVAAYHIEPDQHDCHVPTARCGRRGPISGPCLPGQAPRAREQRLSETWCEVVPLQSG